LARTQAADYEQRREVIVEGAARLFASMGFRGASVADLAKVCNISKSLIYHYYPSKEDVLYAVMASHIDQLIEDVEEVVARGGSPADQVRNLLHAFMHHYVGAADRQKVLLNELANLPDANRAVIVAKQRVVVDAVQALVTRLYPDLADRPGAARAQTMLLFGMINWSHTWFDPAGPISPDALADMAAALFLPDS